MKIKWSYGLNQWNTGHDRFVLQAEHERAFKTLAVSGFDAVEVPAGSGRWEPLGRRDWIERFYGSVEGFQQALAACGIGAVSSFLFNPAEPIFEEGAFGLSPLNEGDQPRILATLVQYADILPQLGGDTLVVRALPDWQEGRPFDSMAAAVAGRCWNAVAAMAAERGVTLALNLDAVTMARSPDDIARLLEHCDADNCGLSIDTADSAIMGLDPLALYRRFAGRVVHVQLKNALARDDLNEYRLPFPEKAMLMGGGARNVPRWYSEMGDEDGLVDIAGFHAVLVEDGFAGWVVAESDQSPVPATSAMLNGWYRRNVLEPETTA